MHHKIRILRREMKALMMENEDSSLEKRRFGATVTQLFTSVTRSMKKKIGFAHTYSEELASALKVPTDKQPNTLMVGRNDELLFKTRKFVYLKTRNYKEFCIKMMNFAAARGALPHSGQYIVILKNT